MHLSGILYAEGVREFKKRFIMNVLRECKGNQCKAAMQLGMHRNTLSRTIAELKLDVREFRPLTKHRARTARDITEHVRQIIDGRKPVVSSLPIQRCNCTGRGSWHVLYGPTCTMERSEAARGGA